jgi:hypothetical protein
MNSINVSTRIRGLFYVGLTILLSISQPVRADDVIISGGTTSAGGSHTGGGNIRKSGITVTADWVKWTLENEVRALLPYVLNNLDMLLSKPNELQGNDPASTAGIRKTAIALRRALFSPGRPIFSRLRGIDFRMEMNDPCKNRLGIERDASVIEPDVICFSASRIAARLEESQLITQLLALTVHELVHVMGEMDEGPAEMAQMYVSNYKGQAPDDQASALLHQLKAFNHFLPTESLLAGTDKGICMRLSQYQTQSLAILNSLSNLVLTSIFVLSREQFEKVLAINNTSILNNSYCGEGWNLMQIPGGPRFSYVQLFKVIPYDLTPISESAKSNKDVFLRVNPGDRKALTHNLKIADKYVGELIRHLETIAPRKN